MKACYFNLSKKEFEKRIGKAFKILENCEICPRNCHINRIKGKEGYCKLGALPEVSAFHAHFWEESVLVGKYGSGIIFFTSCNLSCVYCQNYEISQLRIGKEISFEDLAQMMIKLQNIGCHNINLCSPTSHVPAILKSLILARNMGLKLPLIYNTNTYDSPKTLKLLDGIIDIYMPDTKYSDNKFSLKYSDVPDYFKVMKTAIKKMHKQVGDLVINKQGLAEKGLLVRHLVLPNNISGPEKIFQFLAKEISKNTFLNVMDQYRPCYKAFQFSELARPITKKEYKKTVLFAQGLGLERIYKK